MSFQRTRNQSILHIYLKTQKVDDNKNQLLLLCIHNYTHLRIHMYAGANLFSYLKNIGRYLLVKLKFNFKTALVCIA